ncbi:MAG TPA: LEA type 2 family protein [Gemmatimonadaceae bacterium]|nr:LEA type 2 family protein [Gemmatimonadaceae bacterium]
MRTSTLIGVAVLLAAGAACGKRTTTVYSHEPSVPYYRPQVYLRDVAVKSVGLTGGAMDVTMKVYNPNEYELHDPRISYRVFVDGSEVATGIYDPEVVVPDRDSVTVQVPATFGYSGVRRAGRSILGTGTITYRVIGEIIVSTPYGRYRSPFDRVGNFSSTSALSVPR